MIKIEIRGDRELARKFDRLSKTSQKKTALRKGARAAAKIIQKEAKQLAPKDTGLLRNSIKVRSLKRSRVWVGARVISKFKDEQGAYYGWAVHQLNVEFMFDAQKRMEAASLREFKTVAMKEISKLLSKG